MCLRLYRKTAFQSQSERQEWRYHIQGKRYREILKLAESLKYPQRMKQSERTMIDIARKRVQHS